MELTTIINWILTNGWGLLVAIFSLGMLAFVHELGHFIFAKMYGVEVSEFYMGFGPRLWSKTYNGTEYGIRLVPFGAYVAIKGEESKGDDPNDPTNFQNKPAGQKILILAGGAIMNYVTAIVLFLLIGFIWGIGQFGYEITPRIAEVYKDTPAAAAGIKSGDVVVAINNKPVVSGEAMSNFIHAHPNTPLVLHIKRNKQFVDIKVTPKPVGPKKEGAIGIRHDMLLDIKFVKVPVTAVIIDVAAKTWRFTIAPFLIIQMLSSNQVSGQFVAQGMVGPIGIVQMLFLLFQKGLPYFLFLFALCNLGLGSMNVLPIPALDGMRVFFVVWGVITRKPLDPDKEGMVHWVGFILLIGAMILLSMQDVMRVIQGQSFFK